MPVHRIEVAPLPGRSDPVAATLIRDAAALGIHLTSARSTHVYLIEPPQDAPLDAAGLRSICTKLLADPVLEAAHVGASPAAPGHHIIEVHPLPGVMDPVAESVQRAVADILDLEHPPTIATGWRYDLSGPDLTPTSARALAERLLANPVIQRVVDRPLHPSEFPVSRAHDATVREVPLTTLSDAALEKLSRDAHLFLSLDEMKAIAAHYRAAGREPREIELETLAQTWSEHCVHKTLKSTIRYQNQAPAAGRWGERAADWANRPGHEVQPDGSIVIHNLLKSTVAAATRELIASGVDWTLSVFVDNSGVIAFDDTTAVCVKVETHNRPSAIEPYGGAATGIGGCIRDVIGTGLGARPIASTDVFCVAPPDFTPVPEGCLPPRRILSQVVAGVRDYGNRMGIPTVSGAVAFDPRYVGNPLVYCGCIGVMPRDRVKGEVRRGDLIVALGGRTGRDGIHGATFSSAEISHSAADEFAHAVQIGNAITEKQVLDAILRARDEHDQPLYSALTDCGAGGFSSAVGEMGKSTGATVHLDRAPLKYPGLSPTEIWISEAQERMVLSVPHDRLEALRTICREESVDLAVLGEFSSPGAPADDPQLILNFAGREVGRLSMDLLHEGIPTPRREAVWNPPDAAPKPPTTSVAITPPAAPHPLDALVRLLGHPNIASKHWIIRQYDHEVRASTAIKPLVGPLSRGPSDAAVITPVPGSARALGISCGLQTAVGDIARGGDPYHTALSAIDECVRNLVCVGVDPDRIAILDNFCWPSCKKPDNLAALVRACEGCYDGALAYRTPFVSGKDSLHNEFTTRDGRTIAIPPTLLITGIGILPDLARAVTMDAKEPGNIVLLVGPSDDAGTPLGASHYQELFGLAHFSTAEQAALARVPTVRLGPGGGPSIARAIAKAVASGLVQSAHDVSDGGPLTALAEMLIAGSSPARPIGATLTHPGAGGPPASLIPLAFSEAPSRFLLEVRRQDADAVRALLGSAACVEFARLDELGTLHVGQRSTSVEALAGAWLAPLDF